MESKASLDTSSKVITAGVFLLFIALAQKNIREVLAAGPDLKEVLIPAGALALLLIILLISYLFSTKGYSLSAEGLIIHRPIKDKVIPIADIFEVRLVDPGELRGTIRTFGVGGLFGYYGRFYNSKFGHMIWYATQKENRVLIRTRRGNTLIISPDDQDFISKLGALKSKQA